MKLRQLIFALGLMLLAPAAMAVASPQTLIQTTAEEVLDLINKNQTLYQQQPGQLYQMVDQKVLPHFDFERMTDLALGRYRKKVQGGEKTELVEAFRNMLVRTYGKALLEYTDQKLVFLPSRPSSNDEEVTVRTEIEQAGGFPIPIDYELYLKDGTWKVYDIAIDGISMVTNYRSTFAKTIKEKGVRALIDTLKTRNSEEAG